MKSHPYLSRSLESKLSELFRHFPVVVVSGARQVGKSTLLTHLFPKFHRVVFDPVQDIEGARRDPDLFLQNRKTLVILDEIQYVPELVPAVKRYLEKDRRPGQFLITGSQQWNVMKLLAESLAGRAVFLDLDGLSLIELGHKPTKDNWLKSWLETQDPQILQKGSRFSSGLSIAERIWRGFFPEAQFLPKNLIPDFYAAYHRTYVERDIRQMGNISDLPLFGRFFRLCAALTAQETNYNDLGREFGVTPQTARRWVQLLKATFLWVEIPAYTQRTVKRISHSPKAYLADTGLACWSLAIPAPTSVTAHPSWGALFETAAVMEIRKRLRTLAVEPILYHWRSHGGAEVDLILEWNGTLYPIEMKASSHPGAYDARGLQAFRKTWPRKKIAPGLILSPSENFYQVADHEYVVPWDRV